MILPYDYCRCEATECAIRETCARFTEPWRPDGPQTVSDFSLNQPCGMFIANKRPTEAAKGAE